MLSNKLLFILIILFKINIEISAIIKNNCGVEDIYNKPPRIIQPISNNKRSLQNSNNNELNIICDLTYIEKGIIEYKLNEYHSIIINSFNYIVQILKSLLKIVYKNCFLIYDNDFDEDGFINWNKTKFGLSSSKHYFRSCDYDMDLFILSRFFTETELKNKDISLMRSGILYLGLTGQIVAGQILINPQEIITNIKKPNFEEYFKSNLLHHFIHLLGFHHSILTYIYPHFIFSEIDSNGILRKYIKSPQVLNVAKKYFNCSNIKGVEIENQETALHWESRILLGELMTVSTLGIDEVLSEFTLAFLEDTGLFIANYYTGGLMQYGRNKGCKFIKEKCVQNGNINSKFENEFFNLNYNNLNYNDIISVCSSGRQSRSYFYLSQYSKSISLYYQYYKNNKIGGYMYADYCPVARNYYNESQSLYYIGKCNKLGNDNYIQINSLNKNSYSSSSSNLDNMIISEAYSENSFCYQSSLTVSSNFNNLNRALCYESFCSSKSLTIKINDIYIVCPKQGGKINVIGYNGYFLCPDYYLICSGKILCNDMFDCIIKKSEIKEESYFYNYEPKTSQNVIKAESEEVDNENNYELSDDGICIQYCRQCSKDKKCIKCRNNYELFVNKSTDEIICIDKSELKYGYYKDENTSIYYKCGDNCERCINDKNCIKCNNNYTKINNTNSSCYLIDEIIPYYLKDPNDEYNYISCNYLYNNCLTCNNDQCLSCQNEYVFIENNFKECFPLKDTEDEEEDKEKEKEEMNAIIKENEIIDEDETLRENEKKKENEKVNELEKSKEDEKEKEKTNKIIKENEIIDEDETLRENEKKKENEKVNELEKSKEDENVNEKINELEKSKEDENVKEKEKSNE